MGVQGEVGVGCLRRQACATVTKRTALAHGADCRNSSQTGTREEVCFEWNRAASWSCRHSNLVINMQGPTGVTAFQGILACGAERRSRRAGKRGPWKAKVRSGAGHPYVHGARIAARIHPQCGMQHNHLKPSEAGNLCIVVRDQQEESSGLLLTTQTEPDSHWLRLSSARCGGV